MISKKERCALAMNVCTFFVCIDAQINARIYIIIILFFVDIGTLSYCYRLIGQQAKTNYYMRIYMKKNIKHTQDNTVFSAAAHLFRLTSTTPKERERKKCENIVKNLIGLIFPITMNSSSVSILYLWFWLFMLLLFFCCDALSLFQFDYR